MRKNKQRVDKTRLCVSIPTELLDECDLYIDNYSAYITACLQNKLASIKKKQMRVESTETDTIQTIRTYGSNKTAVSSTLPQKNMSDDDNYEELLREFKAMRARKEQ